MAGRIDFDEDLRTKSLASTETLVKMGDRLGRAGPNAGQPSGVLSLDEINITTIASDSVKPPAATAGVSQADKPPGCCCVCS